MADEIDQHSDVVAEVGKAVGVLKTVIEIAEKSPELTVAGTNLAKSAQTITTLVNNCLLPIAAVNFAFEKGRQYFSEKFSSDLEAITADIPFENIVEPKASIAAPILEGLAFSNEEESLKDMYLHLLKSSMNLRARSIAHPAFVQVVKQLEAIEAVLLKNILLLHDGAPIVQIRHEIKGSGGFNIMFTHVLNFHNKTTLDPIVIENSAAMVDNWIRLGLVTVSYVQNFVEPSHYDWVEKRPEYANALLKGLEGKIVFQKGLLSVTSFGEQFKRAAL